MSKSIGIDLGTANTIVYVRGRGITLREPSVVAVESRSKKVVAVGNEAKLMLGKTPGSITAMRPLKELSRNSTIRRRCFATSSKRFQATRFSAARAS